jgi:hypothetical protein
VLSSKHEALLPENGCACMTVEPGNRTGIMAATDETAVSDDTSSSSDRVRHWGDWIDRLDSLIERYPWPTLLLALGIGYLAARRMR